MVIESDAAVVTGSVSVTVIGVTMPAPEIVAVLVIDEATASGA